MAGKSALIFDYFEEKTSEENKKIAKCKFCTTSIKGRLGVTSNFVTHLKVRTKFCLFAPAITFYLIVEETSSSVQ